jgi:predicted ATPase
MLTSLHIKSFRGFKNLDLTSLKRVNLIVGHNNTGKTGLLEALALLLWNPPSQCGNLPSLFRSVGGDWHENFWKWLFHNKDTKARVVIEADFDNKDSFGVRVQAEQPSPADTQQRKLKFIGSLGNVFLFSIGGGDSAGLKVNIFSTHPSNPKQDAIDYNRVVLHRRKKQVEALLQKIEPKLETVETLQTGKEPLLYADIGLSELIPVTQMGQGFNRLLDIYSEIVVAEARVLLIDEIENGLHHSVLSTIWRGLYSAASEMDVQIFATTHSLECIRAAHEVFSEQPSYDLSIIQLFRLPTGVEARVLDKKHIEAAIAGQIDIR